jgi:hypothetical protein
MLCSQEVMDGALLAGGHGWCFARRRSWMVLCSRSVPIYTCDQGWQGRSRGADQRPAPLPGGGHFWRPAPRAPRRPSQAWV